VLPLILVHRAMNRSLVVAVCVSTMGSQGCMSPVSKYLYMFVRGEVAASVL